MASPLASTFSSPAASPTEAPAPQQRAATPAPPSSRLHAAPAPKWPKFVPPLTPAQQEVSNDFMKYWHKLLPRHFSVVERFNHGYPVWHAPARFRTTLEIGAGLGEHILHEPLSDEQMRNYHT